MNVVAKVPTKNSDKNNNNFLDEGNIATKICKPSYLRLNNEEEYPYNHMTNSEKMYFNNAYWVNTLGKEYFINNFDYILKVRPDIVFDKFNFDFASLKKNTVLAEEGWIFRGWGFGIGDQILVGRSGPMVEILSCHSDKALKDLTTTLYPNSSGFMGHVNLGISAWSKNIMVGKLTDFKHHLKSPPKISIQNIYSKELK